MSSRGTEERAGTKANRLTTQRGLTTLEDSRGDSGSKTHKTGRKTIFSFAADSQHCLGKGKKEKGKGRGEEKHSHSIKQSILRCNNTALGEHYIKSTAVGWFR
jgi:hypothetical protein